MGYPLQRDIIHSLRRFLRISITGTIEKLHNAYATLTYNCITITATATNAAVAATNAAALINTNTTTTTNNNNNHNNQTHLSEGPLVLVRRQQRRQHLRRRVLVHRQRRLVRPEHGLVVVDVLDEHEHGLRDELAVAELVVCQREDDGVLVLDLREGANERRTERETDI